MRLKFIIREVIATKGVFINKCLKHRQNTLWPLPVDSNVSLNLRNVSFGKRIRRSRRPKKVLRFLSEKRCKIIGKSENLE